MTEHSFADDAATLTLNQIRDLFNAYEDTEGANWEDKPGAVESDNHMLICDSGDWGGHVLDAHTKFIALAHRHMPALLEAVGVSMLLDIGRPKQKKWWFVRFVADSKRYVYAFFQHEKPVKSGNANLVGISSLEVEDITARSTYTEAMILAVDAARRTRGPVCVGSVKKPPMTYSMGEWRGEVATGTTVLGYEDWRKRKVKENE